MRFRELVKYSLRESYHLAYNGDKNLIILVLNIDKIIPRSFNLNQPKFNIKLLDSLAKRMEYINCLNKRQVRSMNICFQKIKTFSNKEDVQSIIYFTLLSDIFFCRDSHVYQKLFHPVPMVTTQLQEIPFILLFLIFS